MPTPQRRPSPKGGFAPQRRPSPKGPRPQPTPKGRAAPPTPKGGSQALQQNFDRMKARMPASPPPQTVSRPAAGFAPRGKAVGGRVGPGINRR